MKTNEKEKSIELRKQGLPITEIAKKLGVSKASVFGWTKEVALTEDQKNNFSDNRSNNRKKGAAVWSAKCKDKRIANEAIGRQEINRNNWEHVAGCMLWWAEGDKSRHVVAVTNCDVKILKFFVFFLKKFYEVQDSELRIYVQYHGDLDEQKLGDYWKSALDIPGAKILKGYKKERRSCVTKWPNGICRVRLHSTEIASRLWGSVQEYMGFNSSDEIKKYS